MAPLGQAALDALAPKTGARVLDIGCGAGATSRALADRGCRVLGVDLSAPLLAVARQRAGGPDYLLADAGADPLPGPFDAAFSRFGVMFFADPVAAFTHIRAAMAPGARLAFVCWGPLSENGWAFEPMVAIAPFLPEPTEPPAPNAPGPFAFAQDHRATSILAEAGWRDVAATLSRTILNVGDSPPAALAMLSKIGPAGRALRENPAVAEAAETELLNLFNRYSARTGVEFPACIRIVTASA